MCLPSSLKYEFEKIYSQEIDSSPTGNYGNGDFSSVAGYSFAQYGDF